MAETAARLTHTLLPSARYRERAATVRSGCTVEQLSNGMRELAIRLAR